MKRVIDFDDANITTSFPVADCIEIFEPDPKHPRPLNPLGKFSAGAALDGMNFVKTPNLKQLRALKDLAIGAQYDQASINDKPLRLAAQSSVIVKVPLPQPVLQKKPAAPISYILPV